MTPPQRPTPAELRRIARMLMARNPAYEAVLGFYSEVFAAQEHSRPNVRLAPKPIPREQLAAKRRGQLPLVGLGDFVLDEVESRALLDTLVRLAQDMGVDLGRPPSRLVRALADDAGLAPRLFGTVVQEDDPALRQIAAAVEVPVETLALLAYHSIYPSLSSGAEQLAAHLDPGQAWELGYCPVCGSPPLLGLLDGDGRRSLACRFCGFHWAAPRRQCPFCATREPRSQRYFSGEDAAEWRIDLCDACRGYLKTVDTRLADRLCYPPLEQVASLHLDLRARELGFAGGWPHPP